MLACLLIACYLQADQTRLAPPSRLSGNRRHELEQKLIADTSIPDKEKKNQILALGRTESSFLRLRRTRLGLKDFKTVKVIGKGAFGEVSRWSHGLHASYWSASSLRISK